MYACELRKQKRLPVRSLRTSCWGRQFILKLETAATVSSRLHWPLGSSGVTIGPGYDMKNRDSARISRDMMRIGIDNVTANKISEATHLQGIAAQKFVKDNFTLVNLTYQQEKDLLNMIISEYEGIVQRNIRVTLAEHEFDALVSFVYNPGGSFLPIAHFINRGRIDEAIKIIRNRIITGHSKNKGLIHRRKKEVDLFLEGKY